MNRIVSQSRIRFNSISTQLPASSNSIQLFDKSAAVKNPFNRQFSSTNSINFNLSSRNMSSSFEDNPRFTKTPIPKKNPLGEGKFVKTAGCLIIGDEVLNGKTKDTNSNFLAQFCFTAGIDLKRIEVIADDEEEIIEAARRMSEKYDWVISSGGIGPTHDDITYQSMAKAFNAEPLQYDDETLQRMAIVSKRRNFGEQTEEQMTARKRMALFPSKNVEVIFPTDSLWVPVIRLGGKLCILPGVPRLFEALLMGLEAYLPIDKDSPKPFRLLVHTKMPESSISPYLNRLNEICKKEGIKLGSYPKWNAGVDVSLIGNDLDRLVELGKDVEKELDAKIVSQGKVGEEPGEKL